MTLKKIVVSCHSKDLPCLFSILLIFLFMFIGAQTFAREKVPAKTKRCLKKARKEFDRGNFPLSAVYYKEALYRSPENFDANIELGYLYYKETGHIDSALHFLNLAEAEMPSPEVAELYFYKAQCYRLKGNYNSAMIYYNKFSPFIKAKGGKLKNDMIHALIDCRYGKNVHIRRDSVTIENLGRGINSNFDEYAPVVTSNDSVLLFTARLKKEHEGGADLDFDDDKFFEDMYISRKNGDGFAGFTSFEKDSVTSNVKSSIDHESVVSLSADGMTLFTYKKNAIWASYFNHGEWSTSVKLPPTINKGKNQKHAYISPDRSKIYFSSDMPGGFGGLDLYVSEKMEDGTWGEPRNLGKAVNTVLNEDSPSLSENGEILYFSSDGHLGYGGYDIFMMEKEGDYLSVVNMGMPVNSSGDDIYFNPLSKGIMAYLSSNREGGIGGMDIYKVKFTPSKFSNCVAFKPESLNYPLNGRDYIPGVSGEVDYTWTLPDASEMKGEIVNLNFSRPAVYTVILNAGNPVTGKALITNKEINLNLLDSTYIEFLSPDTVDIDQEFSLNGKPCYVLDADIKTFTWDLGDGRRMDSIIANASFPEPGEYELKMELEAKNDQRLNQFNYCISKKIYVRTEDEKLFAEELENRRKRQQFVQDSIEDARRSALLAAELLKKEKPASLEKQVESTRQNGEVIDDLDFIEIELTSAFFNVNRSDLRKDAIEAMKANVKVLKENPEAGILISAYSDSRGSILYNQKLAGKRADSAVKYLIKSGIKKNRIISVVSHGETGIDCDAGAPCPEEELQKARRVEFKVFKK